ncbi:MAG: hypothetical protein JWN85_1407 [Gammaproteobacteria bacterium]|nr:hypothetical protein [Gammaproteobacteria bacterium]
MRERAVSFLARRECAGRSRALRQFPRRLPGSGLHAPQAVGRFAKTVRVERYDQGAYDVDLEIGIGHLA